MTVEIYIAVLLTVIVVCILAVAVALAFVLVQLRRTARAVETLAIRAGDQVGRVGEMAGSLGQVALGIAGTFGRKSLFGAGLLYSLLGFLRSRRKKVNPLAEPKDSSPDD